MTVYLKNRAAIIGSAVVFLLLQIICAPYITIGYAYPGFLLAFVCVKAIIQAENPGYILPFLLGLAYDLSSSGPVGAWAFVFLVITFLISFIRVHLMGANILVAVPIVVIGCFLGEFFYAILIFAVGLDASFLDAMIYRVLPCWLYDSTLAIIMLPIVAFITREKPQATEMTIIR